MKKLIVLSYTLLFTGIFLFAQEGNWTEQLEDLKSHVGQLASDDFEGRATGTKGEDLAASYIQEFFQSLGLEGAGEDGSYLQTFSALAGKNFGSENFFKPGSSSLKLNEQYYPLEISGNGTVKAKLVDVGQGIFAPSEGVDDYKNKKGLEGNIFLLEISSPAPAHPHAAVAAFKTLRKKVEIAQEKGATAVVFVNSGDELPDPIPDYTKNITPFEIPVVFAAESSSIKKSIGKTVSIGVDLIEDRRTGKNVLAYMDNNSDKIIIIGGHYDHLGYGEFGSRYLGKERLIHNGADDNASGIALILELAESLKKSEFKDANVLFLCFSGEEMGLIGSKYFVENPTINMEEVSFMVNLDMVGRMKNRTLIVNGTGTSPSWGNLLSKASPKGWSINLTTNESGIGPSDHTSFYLKDLPVLAFFTGTHDDYHRPEDDADKLNYQGMVYIGSFLENLVRAGAEEEKLEFTKTKESADQGRRSFRVTMGVMPSYSYDGEGMQIDGVSDEKPAMKAGLKAGDVIIQIGQFKVKDIYGYMDALGQFKRGAETTVIIKRGEEELELPLVF